MLGLLRRLSDHKRERVSYPPHLSFAKNLMILEQDTMMIVSGNIFRGEDPNHTRGSFSL
jgi:hypothetical protein